MTTRFETSTPIQSTRVRDMEHSLGIANDLRELRRLSTWLRDLLEQGGVAAPQVYALELCANEAVSNIVLHATGAPAAEPIRLTLSIAETGVSLRIEDKADPFDPFAAPLPRLATTLDEAEPGGQGLRLIRRLLPASTYERIGGCNVLVLRSQV